MANDRTTDPSAEGARLLDEALRQYGTLRSYSDTVTVITEDGPRVATIVERHKIRTHYRAPRQFFFQFDEDPRAGAERFVIWCDGGDFNSWWSTTRVHEVYTNGRGTVAFALGGPPTRGSTLFMAPLLFPKAQMKGPLVNLHAARLAGTETLGSHQTHRIEAEERSAYANGNGAQVRRTTLWLDVESRLLRKVVQETPDNSVGFATSRITLLIEPDVTEITDPARFRFTVPAS